MAIPVAFCVAWAIYLFKIAAHKEAQIHPSTMVAFSVTNVRKLAYDFHFFKHQLNFPTSVMVIFLQRDASLSDFPQFI